MWSLRCLSSPTKKWRRLPFQPNGHPALGLVDGYCIWCDSLFLKFPDAYFPAVVITEVGFSCFPGSLQLPREIADPFHGPLIGCISSPGRDREIPVYQPRMIGGSLQFTHFFPLFQAR